MSTTGQGADTAVPNGANVCTCGFGDRAAIAQRLAEREALEAARDRYKQLHAEAFDASVGHVKEIEELERKLAACACELNRASHEVDALKLKLLQDTAEACAAVEQRDRAQRKLREIVPLLEKIKARTLEPSWQNDGSSTLNATVIRTAYAADIATIDVWAARALDVCKGD